MTDKYISFDSMKRAAPTRRHSIHSDGRNPLPTRRVTQGPKLDADIWFPANGATPDSRKSSVPSPSAGLTPPQSQRPTQATRASEGSTSSTKAESMPGAFVEPEAAHAGKAEPKPARQEQTKKPQAKSFYTRFKHHIGTLFAMLRGTQVSATQTIGAALLQAKDRIVTVATIVATTLMLPAALAALNQARVAIWNFGTRLAREVLIIVKQVTDVCEAWLYKMGKIARDYLQQAGKRFSDWLDKKGEEALQSMRRYSSRLMAVLQQPTSTASERRSQGKQPVEPMPADVTDKK